MKDGTYWNERCWQQKSWRYGKLLLVWQQKAAESGLWQLFLPGCGPRELPAENRFRPETAADELQRKAIAVGKLLDRKPIPNQPARRHHFFCGWQRFSPFETAVLDCLSRVPAGKVVSYGFLASWAEHPRAARAVGRLMAKNPFPLFYPCHRVVKANGRLGNFGGGTELKQKLLEEEGVTFRKPQYIASNSRFEAEINLPRP
ncbi:MAG: hypothetical protein DRH04_03700 [Deltaproteobacteria bacterium]|nr:MAG: hypothetical protein DRH04_03700 [Deltaproteobacteria bacterium]